MHPQDGNRAIDASPPNTRPLRSLLSSSELVALRGELKAGRRGTVRPRTPSIASDPAGGTAGGAPLGAPDSDAASTSPLVAALQGDALPSSDDLGAAGAAGRSRSSFSPTLRQLRKSQAALSAARLLFPRAAAGDAARLFCVLTLRGKQFKVTPGDVINAERVKGVRVGEALTLPVQLVGSVDATLVGRPDVPRALARLVVEEHVQDVKVIVFKKRRRKRYQRLQGHRRLVTRLRLIGIDCDMDSYAQA